MTTWEQKECFILQLGGNPYLLGGSKKTSETRPKDGSSLSGSAARRHGGPDGMGLLGHFVQAILLHQLGHFRIGQALQQAFLVTFVRERTKEGLLRLEGWTLNGSVFGGEDESLVLLPHL